MKTLKELLKKDYHIWFEIYDDDEKLKFLQFAKDNGCKWISGDEINPNENNCGYHMGINKDLQIGFVSMWCWFANAKNKPRKIKFSEVIGE